MTWGITCGPCFPPIRDAIAYLERARFRRAFADRVRMIQLAEDLASQRGAARIVNLWRPHPYMLPAK